MNAAQKCWAVIPAAGIGQRVGASEPKQYLQIGDKTVLQHALSNFVDNDRIAGLVVSLNSNDQAYATLDICSENTPIYTVTGGDSRAESVLNALNFLDDIAGEQDFVLVHDAARPCLKRLDLDKLIDCCLQDEVGGILAAPVSDTIKKVSSDRIVGTLDRDQIWRALTPQMFRFGLLKQALTSAINNSVLITDEASAIENAGYNPVIVEGCEQNIKITHSSDLKIAEIFLKSMEEI